MDSYDKEPNRELYELTQNTGQRRRPGYSEESRAGSAQETSVHVLILF